MHKGRYLFIFGGTIGDGLLGAHLGRLLRANVPDATLTIVSTRRSSFMRELIGPLPFVDFLEMPKESFGSWVWLLSLVWSPWKCAVYVQLSGMPLWWRMILWFASRRRGSIIARPTITIDEHRQMFDTPLDVLAKWDIPVHEKLRPTLPFNASDCKPNIQPQFLYLVFHFFAGITRRSVPTTRAKEILAAVHAAFPNHALILTGSAGDKNRAERIAQATGTQMRAALGPRDLECLIAGAAAYVGVDTGTTHIAAHLSAPMVVLGHNNAPFWWTPPYTPRSIVLRADKNCLCLQGRTAECFYPSSEGSAYRCIIDISTADIIASIQQVINAKI